MLVGFACIFVVCFVCCFVWCWFDILACSVVVCGSLVDLCCVLLGELGFVGLLYGVCFDFLNLILL